MIVLFVGPPTLLNPLQDKVLLKFPQARVVKASTSGLNSDTDRQVFDLIQTEKEEHQPVQAVFADVVTSRAAQFLPYASRVYEVLPNGEVLCTRAFDSAVVGTKFDIDTAEQI